jgi:hypothetical protein
MPLVPPVIKATRPLTEKRLFTSIDLCVEVDAILARDEACFESMRQGVRLA